MPLPLMPTFAEALSAADRPPVNVVLIKRYLDLGVQNFLIPMVNSVADAEAAVAAAFIPPASSLADGNSSASTDRML